jgi:hypothetical protein
VDGRDKRGHDDGELIVTQSVPPHALNALAVRLRDHAGAIRNPAARAKLGADLETAADVASEHARWRFQLAELGASLPTGTHARNEILKLLGTDMIESPKDNADVSDKLPDLRLGFRQVTETHGLKSCAAMARHGTWLAGNLENGITARRS